MPIYKITQQAFVECIVEAATEDEAAALAQKVAIERVWGSHCADSAELNIIGHLLFDAYHIESTRRAPQVEEDLGIEANLATGMADPVKPQFRYRHTSQYPPSAPP